MKQKKVLSRLISAFVAVIMLIGIMPIISSADDGVILSYTFDTEDTVNFDFSGSNGSSNTQTLNVYDGKTFTVGTTEMGMPFLCGTWGQSVWSGGPGWFNYDDGKDGAVPKAENMQMDNGKLHIKLYANNYMRVRIPNVAAAGQCKVSLDVSDVTGSGLSVTIANGDTTKALICDKSLTGSYDNVVAFASGDYLKITNTSSDVLTFAIDNFLIQKYTPVTATVTGSMPANGTTNVSTYIKPSITFNNVVTDDVMNEIAVYADNQKINAAITKSADSKTVYVAPTEPLPGYAAIEIRIPNNSPVTFTTDDEGVLLHYTFDTKKSGLSFDGKCTLYSYDGKEYTFLKYDADNIWAAGWFSKDGAARIAPTEKEVDIADGKLNVNVAAYNTLGIRIPDTDVVENQKFVVTFTVTNLSGDLKANLDNGNSKRGNNGADYPLAYTETNGVRNYSIVFDVMKGDFLKLTTTKETTFNLDDLIVKKYVESPVNIAGTLPEQNRENVPVYVNPEVTFDNVVTTDYANGIKILKGKDEIETTNTLSSDGKTVTLKTASQLPANSLITVKADDNNSFTFTTGDRNVALFEDFETGKNEDEKFGTIYGVNKLWGSDSVELTNCEQLGSRAIKLTNVQYGAATLSLSPKICGDAANRRLKISFDCYTEGTAVEVKLDGTGREKGTKIVPTLKPGKSHIEVVIGVTYFWNGAVLFQNSGSEVTDIYVDNIRVEDVTENAWADIIYDNNNSLITAVAPKNEDGTFKTDERGFLCTTKNVNQMWTGMSGETLTAKYNNLTDGTYKGYIAVYSGDTLIGASAADITVTNGATNDTVVITLPAEGDTGALSVKAFLWNSEMTPIIEPTVLYNVK